MKHWFEYIIDVHSPEGELLTTYVYPGAGNDFPHKEFNKIMESFGGIGYEFRIRTKLKHGE